MITCHFIAIATNSFINPHFSNMNDWFVSQSIYALSSRKLTFINCTRTKKYPLLNYITTAQEIAYISTNHNSFSLFYIFKTHYFYIHMTKKPMHTQAAHPLPPLLLLLLLFFLTPRTALRNEKKKHYIPSSYII